MAPATRDQVDAYRFGLRRLESALVLGDPVPLHEQIRGQRRAVAAGALLGALGVAMALAAAVVAPRPDWRGQDLVVGRPSGALYAVAHDPDRLVPVANAVAGRLVLGALRAGGGAAAAPVLVDDDVLAGAPRTATAAVPGAPAADPARTVPPRWAVCDESGFGLRGTTVVAGAAPGPPASAADGVLLAGPGSATWLVTGGRRHRLDLRDAAVRAAIGLGDRVPRPASPGLVSALPEGPPLVTPAVPDAGSPAPPGLPGRVGDVVVSRPAGSAPRRYLVLAGGLQEVTPLAADVLAAGSGRAVTEIGPGVVAGVAAVQVLDLAGWPQAAPELREPGEAPAVCWTWSGDGGADPSGGLYLGRMPPLGTPVGLARADGPGEALDTVVVGPGGAVRTTAPAGVGTLWVVSADGVAHAVPDGASAAALGITDAARAPEAALRLLPRGPPLDVTSAGRAVGVLFG